MSNFYGATSLIGGGSGALDKIDGAALADLDGAVIITNSSIHAYHLDAASGAAENSPLVISPDANAGTKRWLLKKGVFNGLISYGNVGIGLGALTPSKLLTVAAVSGTHTEILLKATGLAGVYLDLDAGATNRPAVMRHYLNGTLKWAVGILYLEAGNEKYSIGTTDTLSDAKFTIQSDGKVAIGRDSARGILDIASSSGGADLYLADIGNAGGARILFESDHASVKNFNIGIKSNNLFYIYDEVADVDRLMIDSNGNITIGAIVAKTKLTIEGTLTLKEQAAADADTAAYGQIWVKNTIPNELMFTDDAGSDMLIAPLAYGEISVVGNATETAIASQNVYVQITVFDTNGENFKVTPDHTNDHNTIVKAGRYFISCSITLNSVGGAGSTAEMEVKKNNGTSRVGSLHVDRSLSGGGTESGAITLTGIANLAVDDTIEVWIKNETNTQNYVVEDITLSLKQIGG